MSGILDLKGYKLTFDDEFNTTSISQNDTATTWADIRPTSRLTSNSDIGFGTSAFLDAASGYDPFSVSNGALSITATPKARLGSAAQLDVGPGSWASGLITSQQSFSQEYGYFEMRAKVPAGIGSWPSFWMGAETNVWPPELDVMEQYADSPTTYAGTVHTAGANGQDVFTQTWAPSLPILSNGFHTYGVLWNPNTITFYFDGQAIGSQPTPPDMNQRMYMMADLAITPFEKGTMTTMPQTMQIDYIRAFSNDPNAKTVNLQPVLSPDGMTTANVYGATAANTPAPAPEPTSKLDTLVLHMSEDAYQGNAEFTAWVDGEQVGGVQAVSALHGSGVSQDFALSGSWGTGTHDVSISFINDAWSGTPQTDRNVYVDSMTYDGRTAANSAVSLLGSYWYNSTTVGGSTPTQAAPTDKLVLHLSEDAWQGDAQFVLAIDGKQAGAPASVTASHSLDQTQDFTYSGDFTSGPHIVAVTFINDAWGGTPQTDRNLHINSIDFDGSHYGGTTMYGNSTAAYVVTHS